MRGVRNLRPQPALAAVHQDRAEKIAEKREDDAAFAVQFAYAAIEEAEYAVLDAALARAEADEASAA